MPNRDVYSSKPASLRDFSGGWNVADNEYNTSSRFQPVSDNVIVGVDNAIGPRLGYRMFANCKAGTVTAISQSVTYTTLINTPKLTINWVGHPLSVGDHITITSLGGVIANIPSQPTGTYGVGAVTANSFDIYLRDNATASATSASFTLTGTRDNHVIGGTIIEMAYFQGYLLIFSDIGEICTIGSNVITRIWDMSKSLALAGAPTGWRKQTGEAVLTHVSYDTFKQSLLCCNGRFNDKPLDIDLTRATKVQFLQDPATGSNAFVYSSEFIHSSGGYVLLVASNNTTTPTSNTATTVDISAKNTSGVFVGNPAPDDSVQIDLGRVTQTIEPRITGVSSLREKVVVTFYDSAMFGTLGTYNGAVHDPSFNDQVPQHGAINHRVISNIGNDLLLCDYAGIPAFSQSQLAAAITPERISQLIDPALNKHLSRLSSTTLQYKPFSVYNTRERQYMLFIPKYDSSSVFNGGATPFFTSADLSASNQVLVYAPSHTVSAGDYVTISGAVGFGGLAAGDLNGTRLVAGVVNSDYFIITLAVTPTQNGLSGGGSSVVFTPVNDETIGYVFTLNPQLRIRRWTRFRDLTFTSGCLSREGRVFFSNGSRIYQFGTVDIPYYGDGINDYTYSAFVNNNSYLAGDTVYDSTNATTYKCLTSYTSSPAGSFETERSTYATYWEVYQGAPINWEFETPWSDFGDRLAVKRNTSIQLDATGSAAFTVKAFVDGIYQDPTTYALTPSTTMSFIGKDGGGFGAGYGAYGGGRRTKEQFSYSFPFRCKIAKMRVEGSTTEPLKVSGIFFLYQKGSSIR